MIENRFPIQIRWRSAAEGGRTTPHVNNRYHPTAAIRGNGPHDAFSVVCSFNTNDGVTASGWLSLLFPENFPEVIEQLSLGADLMLFEGPRPTAEVHVLVPSGSIA